MKIKGSWEWFRERRVRLIISGFVGVSQRMTSQVGIIRILGFT